MMHRNTLIFDGEKSVRLDDDAAPVSGDEIDEFAADMITLL